VNETDALLPIEDSRRPSDLLASQLYECTDRRSIDLSAFAFPVDCSSNSISNQFTNWKSEKSEQFMRLDIKRATIPIILATKGVVCLIQVLKHWQLGYVKKESCQSIGNAKYNSKLAIGTNR
jgi:hypothetical protein